MERSKNKEFDLGLFYNKKTKRLLFDGYYLTKDRPKEARDLLNECDCDHVVEKSLSIIYTFVRWGSSKAKEYVGVRFDDDGKIKLLLGWEYKNTRYTATAVYTICKKIIQIIFALQNHGVVGGNAIKKETEKEAHHEENTPA